MEPSTRLIFALALVELKRTLTCATSFAFESTGDAFHYVGQQVIDIHIPMPTGKSCSLRHTKPIADFSALKTLWSTVGANFEVSRSELKISRILVMFL